MNDLRQKYKKRKIALFMDNLSVHRSLLVREHMDALKIKYVFNAPYSPDYNPIEFVFHMLKTEYRKLRIQKILNGTNLILRTLISKSILKLDFQKIKNCIHHSRRLLEENS